MKSAFYKLVCLVLFISSSVGASAQFIPDTARLAIGIDLGKPVGNISDRYVFNAGGSIRFDYPFSKKSYVTLSVGFNNFYLGDASTTTQQAILNVEVPMLQTVPLKLGYKYFLIKGLYVQGEVGETLLLNKAAEYATNSYAFTYSPQIGILFKSKRPGNYLDVGLRYEGVSSFYNDNDKYNFWAMHFSYAFKL